MDERPPKGRPAARHTLRSWLRRLLLLPLPPDGTRVLDVALIFLGIPVALVVCIPILTIIALASIPIGSFLVAIDAPAVVGGAIALVWFSGGLAICFFALLRIYRRLPAAMRALVEEEAAAKPTADPGAESRMTTVSRPGEDLVNDDRSLNERLAAADATLAPRPAPPDSDDA